VAALTAILALLSQPVAEASDGYHVDLNSFFDLDVTLVVPHLHHEAVLAVPTSDHKRGHPPCGAVIQRARDPHLDDHLLVLVARAASRGLLRWLPAPRNRGPP
jgi:hypothetical protein